MSSSRTSASPANSEGLTRRKIIDPKLAAAGWKVCAYSPTRPLSAYNDCALVEYPTDNGPADYALCSGGRSGGWGKTNREFGGRLELLVKQFNEAVAV